MKEPILLTIDVVDEMSAGMAEALAALPTTHAMQAKHLSGASIGKLVEWEVGKSFLTGEHQWSPQGTLSAVQHAHEETSITLQWDDYGLEEIALEPNDWVRVTQVPA